MGAVCSARIHLKRKIKLSRFLGIASSILFIQFYSHNVLVSLSPTGWLVLCVIFIGHFTLDISRTLPSGNSFLFFTEFPHCATSALFKQQWHTSRRVVKTRGRRAPDYFHSFLRDYPDEILERIVDIC